VGGCVSSRVGQNLRSNGASVNFLFGSFRCTSRLVSAIGASGGICFGLLHFAAGCCEVTRAGRDATLS
jgi:hypothetical protein